MATNSKEYNKKNYKKYRGSPTEIKKRSNRNKARRKVLKGKKSDKEVDHKNSNALDNSDGNLRLISRKTNRKLGAAKANKRKGKGYKKAKTITKKTVVKKRVIKKKPIRKKVVKKTTRKKYKKRASLYM